MIRYTLLCRNEHSFETWFRDSAAYESLAAGGQVACPDCGSAEVRKALMAPSLVTGRRKSARLPRAAEAAEPTGVPAGRDEKRIPVVTDHDRELRDALRDLRRRIAASATNVGRTFAAEARAIHDGSAPERAIYGEATREEVGSLLEDGIPLLPMPPLPDDHN